MLDGGCDTDLTTHLGDEDGTEVGVGQVAIINLAFFTPQTPRLGAPERPTARLALDGTASLEHGDLSMALGRDGVFDGLEAAQILDLCALAETHDAAIGQ